MRRRVQQPAPPEPGCPLCGAPLFHGPFCMSHMPGWVSSTERAWWCLRAIDDETMYRARVEKYTYRVKAGLPSWREALREEET